MEIKTSNTPIGFTLDSNAPELSTLAYTDATSVNWNGADMAGDYILAEHHIGAESYENSDRVYFQATGSGAGTHIITDNGKGKLCVYNS